MKTAIYEAPISDTLKVTAYYDEDAYPLTDLLGIDGDSGIFMLPNRGYYGALDYWITKQHSYGGLTNELLDLCGRLENFKNYGEIKESLLVHANRANYVSKSYSFSGHNQGEYMEAIVYGQGDYINGMAETVAAWIKGEIYTVVLETLEIYTSSTGKVIENWEFTESIGGVLLDSGNEAELIGLARLYLGVMEGVAA